MPSSEPAGRARSTSRALLGLLRHRALGTALLTGLLAGAFALGVARGEVTVRGGQGGRRVMPIVDVWGAFLDRLPPQAPDWVSRELMLILLVLAGIAFAYVLAATLRLPPEDS